MKVILLDNIKNLGKIGDQVEIKSGYARNYLIPQSKAVLATTQNIEIFGEQQNVLQSKVVEKKIQAESFAKSINDIGNVTIMARSSTTGKLFGSVGSKDIAEAITKLVGFRVFKSQIKLPNDDSLKFIGVYNIKVHIYNNIFANLSIKITSALEHGIN